MDVLLSSAALVVLAPAMAVIALLIKLDSPGPALFVQTRVGKGNKPFGMFKFRTMTVNAEAELASLMAQNEREGPAFKMRNDPRVTRIGKHLRRFALDELPQFANAFLGSMSLVGPRPPTPNEVNEYLPWHLLRLDVVPGITCTWQISKRNQSFDEWVAMDLAYISNQSILYDLYLVFKTLKVFLYGHPDYEPESK